MSSLMHCFAAIAGSIREKTKMGNTRPTVPPTPLLTEIVKYVFVLMGTCSNYCWKKVLPAYCHFNLMVTITEPHVNSNWSKNRYGVVFIWISFVCQHQMIWLVNKERYAY